MTTIPNNNSDLLSDNALPDNNERKIKVLLADDHPVVRTGLRVLLEKAADITVVAEAETGTEVLTLVTQVTPDVIVLDIEMPELNGVEVLSQFRELDCKANILVLSAHTHASYIREMLSKGASGYLVKDEAPKMIIDAVRGTARGKRGWFSQSAAAEMSELTYRNGQVANKLTDREHEVMLLVAAGKTNREIGLALGISEKTVEKHISSLLVKLDANSRVEVAVYAVRQGFA